MSVHSKTTGKVVQIDDHAMLDFFVGQDIVELTLETETSESLRDKYPLHGGFRLSTDLWWELIGQRNASGLRLKEIAPDVISTYSNGRYSPVVDSELYDRWEAVFCPASGDTVSCVWDYQHFSGEIIILAENRQPVSRNLPVTGD